MYTNVQQTWLVVCPLVPVSCMRTQSNGQGRGNSAWRQQWQRVGQWVQQLERNSSGEWFSSGCISSRWAAPVVLVARTDMGAPWAPADLTPSPGKTVLSPKAHTNLAVLGVS